MTNNQIPSNKIIFISLQQTKTILKFSQYLILGILI